MSFFQLPQIDEYSENEDQGNNRFRNFFCQKNGFMPTKPEADKGCDFIVSLIEQRSSRNYWFSVQMKSIVKPDVVRNGQFIAYSIKTSSLHYMVDAVPPVGLIILYHPATDRIYYDYAENIYSRLLVERGERILWEKQETITIHVPTSNFINEATIKDIHQFILTRHENSQDRSPSLYPAEKSGHSTPAITSDVPAVILKHEGLTLYYDYQLTRLKALLDEVPYKLLREDPHLSLLAGITFSDMGMYVDADYFLVIALQHEHINDDDRQHAEWAKLHNDSYLGKISKQAYNEHISTLLEKLQPTQHHRRIHYKLCITRNEIELLKPSTMKSMFDLADKCYAFDRRIAEADLDGASSVYFQLLNALNFGVLLLQVDRFFRLKFFLEKQNGVTLDRKLYEEFTRMMKTWGYEVERRFAYLKPLARNFVHSVMLAKCLESQVSINTHLELSTLRYPLSRLDLASQTHRESLLLHIHFAKEALEIFTAHGQYFNAYNVTLMLLELAEIAAFCNAAADLDLEDLQKQCKWLQTELKVGPPTIQAKQLIDNYKGYYK